MPTEYRRYDDDEKETILRHYVDNGKVITVTSKETNTPYQTMLSWLKCDWAKLYIANYEISLKHDLTTEATKQIIEAQTRSVITDYNFNVKANIILEMIEDRAIKVIPKTKSLKELAAFYKVVADIKLRLMGIGTDNDKNKGDDNRQMILNLIENQNIIRPVQLKDLLSQAKIPIEISVPEE